jgi:hypothetical protein
MRVGIAPPSSRRADTRRSTSPALRVRSISFTPAPRSGEGGPPASGGWWKGRKAAPVVMAAIALASLAACSSSGDSGAPWYESGDASYDQLKAATDACKAKGGVLKLKSGGDPTHLSDYACRGAKGS